MNARELFQYRSFSLVGDVGPGMVNQFDNDLRALPSTKPEPVVIYLTSTGGHLAYGIGLYERLRLLQRTRQVWLAILGESYSAATLVMLAVPAKFRLMGSSSILGLHQFMIEPPAGRQTIDAARERAENFMNDVAEAERVYRIYISLLARDLGWSLDRVRRRTRKNWYLTGRQARSAKLVGGIIR